MGPVAAFRPAGASGPEGGPDTRSQTRETLMNDSAATAKKVLVVDYDPEYQKLLTQWLTAESIQVILAPDGLSGLETYKKESPDLVVLEAMLPRLHGFELCSKITGDLEKKTPVIITTSVYRDAAYKTEALRTFGAAAYFEKPPDKGKFMAAVRLALGVSEPVHARPAAAPAARPGRKAAGADIDKMIMDTLGDFAMDRKKPTARIPEKPRPASPKDTVWPLDPEKDVPPARPREAVRPAARPRPEPAPAPAPVTASAPRHAAPPAGATPAAVVERPPVFTRPAIEKPGPFEAAVPFEKPAPKPQPPWKAAPFDKIPPSPPAPVVDVPTPAPAMAATAEDAGTMDLRTPAFEGFMPRPKKASVMKFVGPAAALVIVGVGAFLILGRKKAPAIPEATAPQQTVAQNAVSTDTSANPDSQLTSSQETAANPAATPAGGPAAGNGSGNASGNGANAAEAPRTRTSTKVATIPAGRVITQTQSAQPNVNPASPTAESKLAIPPSAKPAAKPERAAADANAAAETAAGTGAAGAPAANPPATTTEAPAAAAPAAPSPSAPVSAPLPKAQAGDLVPIESVNVAPRTLKDVPPVYPPLALQTKTQGAVTVNALISEKGEVLQVVFLRGLQSYGFDKAALTAVKKWRFQPAIKDGVPVKVWKTITVNFRSQ